MREAYLRMVEREKRRMRSQAQARAEAKYNAKLKMVCIKLNPDKDQDIIDILSRKENKTEYIKGLIRKHDTQ